MPRYAAFLRGVSPMNARMPDLKRAFEAAGFTEVRTLLSSGNVLFTAPRASGATLERRAEQAMEAELGKAFLTMIRSVESLQEILSADPFKAVRLRAGERRVITFFREPPSRSVELPIRMGGARIVAVRNTEAFTTYIPEPPAGPDFMRLIEKTFGKAQTTRTWETVTKAAR